MFSAKARRALLWAGALLAAVVLLLVFAEDAFARAGGGHSYSGGGGARRGGGGGRTCGGGGSGGGDGALLYLLFQLIRLAIAYPYVGVPALVVVGFLAYRVYGTGATAYQSSVIRRGTSYVNSSRRDMNLRALMADDPGFYQALFIQRATDAFVKIQSAWAQQNLASVRAFVSDGIHERFSLQFEEQRYFGYRNQVQNVRVARVEIAAVEFDEVFQELALRITASADDYNVSLADGRQVGQRHSSQFTEIWSYVRRRGAQTKAGAAGLIEGNCPNCGSAIEMNQSANCQYCGAVLRSGEHDWVLVEITQECEWDGRPAGIRPGVLELRKRDPGFNVQSLEDMASVMFWRRCAAERIGRADPLRKVATEAYCGKFMAEWRQRAQDLWTRGFFAVCGVGSVDVRGIVSDGDFDRALVEVRWSGKRFVADGASAARPTGQELVARSLLVLRRNAGAQTNVTQAVSSAHCPSCGAPESNSAASSCEFCGTALADGRRWVLEDVLSLHDGAARAWLERLHRPALPAAGSQAPGAFAVAGGWMEPADRVGLLAWMISMVLADGEIDERERAMLTSVAKQRKIGQERLDSMVKAAMAGQLQVPQPADRDEAREWIGAMAAMALADGKLARQELALLQEAGRRIGLATYDLNQILKQKKAELYATARSALREKRRGGAAVAAARR